MNISDIKRADYNPRFMTEEQRSALAAEMTKFGQVIPLLVNKRNNVLVSGHQRLDFFEARGDQTVWVTLVELDERQERLLNMTMNRIGGEFEEKGLAEMIEKIQELSPEMTQFTGLSGDELAELQEISQNGQDFSRGARFTELEEDMSRGKGEYGIRPIIAIYKPEVYAEVLEKMEAYMQAQGIENHTDAFVSLLDKYGSENN